MSAPPPQQLQHESVETVPFTDTRYRELAFLYIDLDALLQRRSAIHDPRIHAEEYAGIEAMIRTFECEITRVENTLGFSRPKSTRVNVGEGGVLAAHPLVRVGLQKHSKKTMHFSFRK